MKEPDGKSEQMIKRNKREKGAEELRAFLPSFLNSPIGLGLALAARENNFAAGEVKQNHKNREWNQR